MKKVLLTAALGCAMISPAFAQADNEVTGAVPFMVNDFIELFPHGAFPPEDVDAVFNNPDQMMAGFDLPTGDFFVKASRSWIVNYSATDFQRDPDATPLENVDETIPSSLIMEVGATTTDPLVQGTPLHAVENAPGNEIARGMGGLNRPYTVIGKITPGNVIGQYNMEGIYLTEISQIATLMD